MLARSWSVALVGLRGHVIEIQADLSPGLPRTTLIGLPDASLNEARDRVRSAIVNSGAAFPQQRLTVGLSPATLPKAGSHYDVAIAAAVLAAAEAIPAACLDGVALVGELGLDGRIRSVRGVLAMAMAAARGGLHTIYVPEGNAGEAALIPGLQVFGVRSLRQVGALLTGVEVPDEPEPAGAPDDAADPVRPRDGTDLAQVLGQHDARLALEVAAAGGHHLYLHGPPGAGKTMLAERLPGLLPDLDPEVSLEVSAVHSLAGLLAGSGSLVTRPPYVAPHHSATLPSLAGGGSGMPRPGAISCAHGGVLFLDEAAEMHPATLDALRQPLESGSIEVHRSGAIARFPARFLLVLAANPCPCGLAGTPGGECVCPPSTIRRYAQRISGPIRDRIDISRPVLPVPGLERSRRESEAEPSEAVAERVSVARDRQRDRFADDPWRLNAEVPGPVLHHRLPLPDAALALLDELYAKGQITIRGIDRVHRLAWSIADLTDRDPVADDVYVAYQLRTGRPVLEHHADRDLRTIGGWPGAGPAVAS